MGLLLYYDRLLARTSGKIIESTQYRTVTRKSVVGTCRMRTTQTGVCPNYNAALQKFDKTIIRTEDLVSCLGNLDDRTMDVLWIAHSNIEMNMYTLLEPFIMMLTNERSNIHSHSFLSIFLCRGQLHIPFAARYHKLQIGTPYGR